MIVDGQNDGDSAQTLTVDSAADVLEGLLSDKSEEQQPGTEKGEAPVEQPEPKDETAAGDEPEEVESEEQSDEPEEDDEPAPEPRKLKVRVDGEEVEVTEDELLKGYSRTQDYTRKTQKLAEERRQLEAELHPEREAVRADRQRYATSLIELETALKSLSQEPDWDALRRESPEAFSETWAAWDQHSKRLAKLSEERVNAIAAVEKDVQRQHQTYLNDERAKLLTAIPAWSDNDVAKRESDDLLAYGKTLGFSEPEIRGVSDHRALVALRKAMLFDKAEAAAEAGKKTAQAKIEKVKVAAPGTGARKPSVTNATRAKQRHSKVGSVDSAAEALTLMLDD